jgi:ergothioneine biosynthesis protein EgtB
MMSASSAAQASPIAEQLLSVRSTTLRLVSHLSAEDLMLQPMADASPAKWHLAHTTWFFETFILCEFMKGYKPFHDDFRRLFNSYYKQVGAHPNRAQRGLFSRPTLDEVLEYRDHVDRYLSKLMADDGSQQVRELVTLGIHHEQQHQELILTDLKYAFWTQPLQPTYLIREDARAVKSAAMLWLDYPGDVVEVGHSGSGFCYDNETPRHKVLLQPFRIASRLVTNGDYLEFMRAGGYSTPNLWLSDGWDTAQREQWQAPLYWERDENDGWRVFTLHGWEPVREDEPVCHISYFEADAFAHWAGARLPLETEWETAASNLPTAGNFAESRSFHPQSAESADGIPHQMFGDVWEWTASPYTAYPGFKPAAGAIGEYNGKFMCNQYVLRGGSCATPESHIRPTYRNFFPAHARWQFMGMRLATDGAIA